MSKKRNRIAQRRHAQNANRRKRRVAVAQSAAASALSPRHRPELLPSPDLPADKLALLEQFDGYAPLRNALRAIAQKRGDWAGIPMPMDGIGIVIEPTYPMAATLMAMAEEMKHKGPKPEPGPEDDDIKIRNQFWSFTKRRTVWVYEHEGKCRYVADHLAKPPITLALNSLSVCDAWGIEQEARAVQTLGTLLRHRQFKQYMLTGMFAEKSPRSQTHYLFRRLRPTIAFTTNGNVKGRFAERCGETVRIMSCLCMHPIGYYEDSWAGAMAPTDDLISHLMLMRGDEHMFWRRCNQHAPWVPQSGI